LSVAPDYLTASPHGEHVPKLVQVSVKKLVSSDLLTASTLREISIQILNTILKPPPREPHLEHVPKLVQDSVKKIVSSDLLTASTLREILIEREHVPKLVQDSIKKLVSSDLLTVSTQREISIHIQIQPSPCHREPHRERVPKLVQDSVKKLVSSDLLTASTARITFNVEPRLSLLLVPISWLAQIVDCRRIDDADGVTTVLSKSALKQYQAFCCLGASTQNVQAQHVKPSSKRVIAANRVKLRLRVV
jgi:hypothetical protein